MPGLFREAIPHRKDLGLGYLVPHHLGDIIKAEAEAEGLVELDPDIVRDDDDLVRILAIEVCGMGASRKEQGPFVR
jgi:hypothetical protein